MFGRDSAIAHHTCQVVDLVTVARAAIALAPLPLLDEACLELRLRAVDGQAGPIMLGGDLVECVCLRGPTTRCLALGFLSCTYIKSAGVSSGARLSGCIPCSFFAHEYAIHPPAPLDQWHAWATLTTRVAVASAGHSLCGGLLGMLAD